MTTLQIIILAIVQGLTEFLPISSSGHLVLVPYLFQWTDQGLAFDVAVHVGSLAAVCIFFRKDIASLLSGGVQVLGGNVKTAESRMALAIALGTIPAALAGLLFASWIEQNLRDPAVIVYTLAGYGILMALADRYGRRERNISGVGFKDSSLAIILRLSVEILPAHLQIACALLTGAVGLSIDLNSGEISGRLTNIGAGSSPITSIFILAFSRLTK